MIPYGLYDREVGQRIALTGSQINESNRADLLSNYVDLCWARQALYHVGKFDLAKFELNTPIQEDQILWDKFA